jgi:hypothetical protein
MSIPANKVQAQPAYPALLILLLPSPWQGLASGRAPPALLATPIPLTSLLSQGPASGRVSLGIPLSLASMSQTPAVATYKTKLARMTKKKPRKILAAEARAAKDREFKILQRDMEILSLDDDDEEEIDKEAPLNTPTKVTTESSPKVPSAVCGWGMGKKSCPDGPGSILLSSNPQTSTQLDSKTCTCGGADKSRS